MSDDRAPDAHATVSRGHDATGEKLVLPNFRQVVTHPANAPRIVVVRAILRRIHTHMGAGTRRHAPKKTATVRMRCASTLKTPRTLGVLASWLRFEPRATH